MKCPPEEDYSVIKAMVQLHRHTAIKPEPVKPVQLTEKQRLARYDAERRKVEIVYDDDEDRFGPHRSYRWR